MVIISVARYIIYIKGKEFAKMLLSTVNKLKDLYNREKNGNGLMLTHECDLHFNIHRKDTPEEAMMDTAVSCGNTTALVDIALIAGCAAAVLVMLGILKGILKLLFR